MGINLWNIKSHFHNCIWNNVLSSELNFTTCIGRSEPPVDLFWQMRWLGVLLIWNISGGRKDPKQEKVVFTQHHRPNWLCSLAWWFRGAPNVDIKFLFSKLGKCTTIWTGTAGCDQSKINSHLKSFYNQQ